MNAIVKTDPAARESSHDILENQLAKLDLGNVQLANFLCAAAAGHFAEAAREDLSYDDRNDEIGLGEGAIYAVAGMLNTENDPVAKTVFDPMFAQLGAIALRESEPTAYKDCDVEQARKKVLFSATAITALSDISHELYKQAEIPLPVLGTLAQYVKNTNAVCALAIDHSRSAKGAPPRVGNTEVAYLITPVISDIYSKLARIHFARSAPEEEDDIYKQLARLRRLASEEKG